MSKAISRVVLFLRSTSRSTLFILACATISLIFGLYGWYSLRGHLSLNIGDVVYRSIAALTLGVPFQSSANWLGDWRIEIARWSGMIALITGASKTVLYLLENRLKESRAERRRGHWMVIGDDSFAARLCDAALQQGHVVHWLACDQAKNRQQKGLRSSANTLFTDSQEWNIARAVELGLHNAQGVVVSTFNDATTHAIAREIRFSVPDENQLIVMASIQSPWLGMRVDEIDNTSGVSIFSEAQMAVRRLHRKHPPFLLAEKSGQTQMHIVIVGFSGYGEAVLIETLLSSLTLKLQKPVFSIIDQAADSVQNSLQLRYPELEQSVTLNFVNGNLAGRDQIINPDTLATVINLAPVTAVYCCDNNDGRALTSALAISTTMVKQPAGVTPVFTRQTQTDSLPPVSSGVSDVSAGQLIAFGALTELALDTGLFTDEVDSLAKTFHNAYQSVAGQDKPANTPWENLSEDMRDASRRLVVHIPAKLHCMGLDIDQWIIDSGNNLDITRMPKINLPTEQDELIEQLAELEHQRWMADRRINGWTYNKDRDDTRRQHPDLVAYDQLSDESKSYDRKMIASLIEIMSPQ